MILGRIIETIKLVCYSRLFNFSRVNFSSACNKFTDRVPRRRFVDFEKKDISISMKKIDPRDYFSDKRRENESPKICQKYIITKNQELESAAVLLKRRR